jgi:hypothetical protein
MKIKLSELKHLVKQLIKEEVMAGSPEMGEGWTNFTSLLPKSHPRYNISQNPLKFELKADPSYKIFFVAPTSAKPQAQMIISIFGKGKEPKKVENVVNFWNATMSPNKAGGVLDIDMTKGSYFVKKLDVFANQFESIISR